MMMPAGDAELVGRALAGERDAFAALVDRYRDAVCGVAYHYLGNPEDVRDAAQEAFVRAYSRLSQLRDPDRFGPWLRSIAANACADVLRRRGESLLSLDAMEERDVPVGAPLPDEDIERMAMRLVVRDALNRLSEKTRLTLTLAYINGYTHQEIAGFLEVPVATVRSRLQHAKKQLRGEIITMVSDELAGNKPDQDFTRDVVEEAIRRGHEAQRTHASGDAIQHYDEALAAMEQWESSEEQRRLRMDALWSKGTASQFPVGPGEAVQLYEQALAIAEELASRPRLADMTEHVGVSYANLGQSGKAEECYRKALALYQELGDARGQAKCLMWLGSQRMHEEPAAGRPYYEQALPLFEAAGDQEWVAVCRAMFDLLSEVGEERFPQLLSWATTCEVLAATQDAVAFQPQPGSSTSRRGEIPAPLSVAAIFHQVGQLRKFLDVSVPVGGNWSGDTFSYSRQPLRATVTVLSDSERVTVPAGTFECCLLTEQVTVQSGVPDDAPERSKELNRKYRCGTRRAWYAPGVGLVRLHVQPQEGADATIQLHEYSVAGGDDSYLPLAEGNTWVYGWADTPPEFTAKEVYRVLSHAEDMWYLERYHYVLKG